MGLFIDRGGYVDAANITKKVFPLIERGRLEAVNGIVVHQTGGSNAQGTFSSYSKKTSSGEPPNGAHFLIDKDGTIYQTASLFRVTSHVGFLQSRCVLTQKCASTELASASALEKINGNRDRALAIHAAEKVKPFPSRYPSNADAIGIELVGEAPGEKGKEVFVPVTDQQNHSLRWLIKELVDTLGVSMQEIYKHPDIARKNVTEAKTAKW